MGVGMGRGGAQAFPLSDIHTVLREAYDLRQQDRDALS